jgi:tetratricopeptide (TPR) repeat protein
MPVLLTILAIVCATAVDARAQLAFASLTLPAAPLMRAWVDAVFRHRPGSFDSAVLVPASWNRDEVRHAWIYVQLLMRQLRDQKVPPGTIRVQAGTPTYIRMSSEALDDLRAIALEVQQSDQVDLFLKRAALLHTDTVRFITGDSAYAAGDVSMLMPQRVMVETEDGQQRSLLTGAVHWEFARVVLDQVDEVGQDSFVRDWYRATMRHKLGRDELDAMHFEHALRLFPNDADIRFLAGCLHEGLADPQVQAARSRIKLPPQVRLAFGGTGAELAQAQSLFQSAVELDANHAEARLRLGRTLLRRGRVKEAIAELQRAIGDAAEPVLRYYAHLFLGSALEPAGRFDEARRALDSALALFPDAQAPRLGLSQLAHRQGDRAEAERVLREVLVPGGEKSRDADPWWEYSTASGRRSMDALDALGSTLPPPAPRP